MGNNDKNNKRSNKWHVLPAAKARSATQKETMKPRLSELNTDAVRRVLITMLWLDSPRSVSLGRSHS